MSEYAGKVVLIAGALGTVGVGIAAQFRAKGATVRIIEDEIGDPVEFDRRCDEVAAEHGRLDLVIQCHGAVSPQPPQVLPTGEAPTPSLSDRLRHWRDTLLRSVDTLRPVVAQERRWTTS
jgi:hypothetical protein